MISRRMVVSALARKVMIEMKMVMIAMRVGWAVK